MTDTIITNEYGGSQSKIEGRFDLLPATAIREAAVVLEAGAVKYGEYNWQLIPSLDHINHAVSHLFTLLERNQDSRLWFTNSEEDDLVHALVRLMFAVHMRKVENDNFNEF